jgi:D-beta-D-heptose 7-phosphate kinase/D-beta-D-heptose 1-phosphate adenosyltransferase
MNMKKSKVIIVSGYFNPIHKGHLELFNKCKELGDYLCVIVNSDYQRELKGSKEFMNEDERMYIIKHLKQVNRAVISIDRDKTQCETLRYLYDKFNGTYDLAFANGGDQNNNTIPERVVCEELGIELIDGLGEKIQSSSWLLK